MDDQPRIVARAAQPYVAVTERVTLDQFRAPSTAVSRRCSAG